MVTETIKVFEATIRAEDGVFYMARACGGQRADGLWEGFLLFESPQHDAVLRTERETTQPNRDGLAYWADGLGQVYLEGALGRARALVDATPISMSVG